MRITNITLYHVDMPMKFAFKTAKETLDHRESIIIKAVDEIGNVGYGETVSFTTPFYTDETLDISWEILKKEYLPIILDQEIFHPFEIHSWFGQQYPMTVAGLENALLNIYAKRHNENIIYSVFREKMRSSVDLGIVLGDLPVSELEDKIWKYQKQGCKRYKIKVKPEDGYEKMQNIIKHFPKLKFAIDANRSFPISQIKEVKRFENLGLLCIEEPFMVNNVEAYCGMQQKIETPICLDESIQTMENLIYAVSNGACKTINLKIGRVGGLFYIKQMIEYCRKNKIGYWIGSMVESGVSKILHIQLAALMDTYMAGDLSDSQRYFYKDFIFPEIQFKSGKMKCPKGIGLGVQINEAAIEMYAVEVLRMEG